MAATTTPKQGHHVFNAIDIALLRPFERIRSLRSTEVDGQHFLNDYLLYCYSLAKTMADTSVAVAARQFVATASAEENALREIARLRWRYPMLARITPEFLPDVHVRNSDQFGAACDRYERQVLTLVHRSLETALTMKRGKPSDAGMPMASIACQQMLNAAYDPAAALIVVTNSMLMEAQTIQGALHRPITCIADTLERRAMWREAFLTFREIRDSATGNIIGGIRDVLTKIELLKAQSMTFTALITNEIQRKSQSGEAAEEFGAMLHLLHARLQQTY